MKTALIFGSTGLVGSELLSILLNSSDYQTITVAVRKELLDKHPKLKHVIVDFECLEEYEQIFQVDDVYCCLGTTMRKAGSKEAFKKVDLDYPLEIGQMSLKASVRNFLIITAMGSDPASRLFYNRTKGELEEQLMRLPFYGLHIFRPSLLLGKRQEFRLGESFAAAASKMIPFLFAGPMQKYRPIKANRVAQAMYRMGQTYQPGVHIYESEQIQRLGKL